MRHPLLASFSFAALIGAVSFFAPQTSNSLTQDNGPATLPAITPQPRTATMLFVGDIMLSRAVGDMMVRQNDWAWPFRHIASVTADADLLFGNLETTISNRGAPAGCGFCFRADPRAMGGLTYAGFDVLSVANNHIWDYGADAFVDTLSYLEEAGMSPVGGGVRAQEAREPVFRNVGGTRVAFLAYTNLLHSAAGAGTNKAGANIYSMEGMEADVADATSRADVVVVSYHAGQEYELEPASWQRQMYEATIDAGADLVVGHHPHVRQPLEQYGGGWIAYSLGNFIFDQSFSDETMMGLMLEVGLADGQVTAVRGIPIRISKLYQASLAR